jgi:hypothetical protein
MALTRVVYLLHYAEPIGDPSRPRMWAQHYIGSYWYDSRITHHANGTSGVAIVTAFYRKGIPFELVRKVPGTKELERRIKSNGHFAEYCPRCRPQPRKGYWDVSDTNGSR